MNSYMDIKKIMCVKDVKVYRLQLVQHALKYGIKPTARAYKTTPKTVRKWVKRYLKDKEHGMKDLPRTKTNCPNKIDPDTEQRIIEFRKSHMSWGARRIKEVLQLSYSHVAIHRVIKQAGLVKPRRKKNKKRKDMSKVRAQIRAFSRFQVDVKYLTDIPEYEYCRWENNLPKYLITARDYKTGATYFAFTHEKTPVATGLFMDLFLSSLKRYGIPPESITIQTDNGTEFTNPRSKKLTYFESIVIEKYNAKHYKIPYARPTWNSDVESYHNLIEEEFFTCEKPADETDLIARSWAYQIWFNSKRTNRGRNNMSPDQIFKMELGKRKAVPVIPPFVVDRFIKHAEKVNSQGGYFLALPPTMMRIFTDYYLR
jgi:transposase